MKKAILSYLALAMCLSLCVPAFAVENASSDMYTAKSLGTTTRHYWSFETGKSHDETCGSWKLIYNGDPATRNGEEDNISYAVSYTNTFTGTIGGGLKGKIEASLGYSFGHSEEFSVQKKSAPLSKGEYVKAYYIKNYEVTSIIQTHITHTYGFELGACGTYNKVDRWQEVPAPTLEAKRAILPKIKLEYFEDSKARSLNPTSTLLYTEYYEYVAGQYQLVSRQFA